MDAPELCLSVSSLCSKWGFNDGDVPEAFLDYWDEIGVSGDDFDDSWHDVLRALVRAYLVPAIEDAGHTVEVYDIETTHNPIRADQIDGEEIDDYYGTAPFELSVTVPYEDVAAAAGIPVAAREG